MKDLYTSILILILFTVGLGVIYPFAVWGVGQAFFPHQANGSLLSNPQGEVIGSELIGQNFTSRQYFHSRPSAAGIGYDAGASSGSNLGPTNEKLIVRVKDSTNALAAEAPGKPIPADLVTMSGSGLDPHISPAAADFQIRRIAKERGIDESDLRRLVGEFTESRTLGILGEQRVNVLLLNIELDRRHGKAVN